MELWNNRWPMRAARLQILLSAVCFGTTGTAQALGPDGIPPAVDATRTSEPSPAPSRWRR